MASTSKTSVVINSSAIVDGQVANASGVTTPLGQVQTQLRSGQVGISTADTHVKHLEDAITAGTGIAITKQNTGADEELEISASAVPASVITSGTLDVARVPNLDANKITSGTLDVARIPNLNASKITAGAFGTGTFRFNNSIILDSPTVAVRGLWYRTNDQARWIWYCDDTAESGADAGSDLRLARFSDTDVFASVLFARRSDGQIGINTTNPSEQLTVSGNVSISGSISKGSGSFKIDHPLPEKRDTHHLVHSFIESPQADLIYRGRATLVAGAATVNIDAAAGMTDGTFAAFVRDVQVFTSNETGWTAVRGAVSGGTLTIEAQDAACTDTISWLVVGERCDAHMYETGWTDADGRVIVEPEKPPVEPESDNHENQEGEVLQ